MSAWETVRYRDIGGVLRKTELKFGNELPLPGAALPSRMVTNSAGDTMIQKWVPEHLGERDACFYDLLDAEIRAGVRLAQMYGSSGNLSHFPAALGYNVDVAEPFVLLEFYRGEPLTRRRLDLHELREFAICLLRVLAQTAEAGVVHGAVRLDSLRWDPQTRFLQLVNFEHSLRHGDQRRPMSAIPGLSREQLDGAGQADVRDDMWGAGMTIRQLALGPHANSADPLPAQFETLLHGVFLNTAATRPHAMDLLARLGQAGSVGRSFNPEAALYPGHQLFDQVTARKHQAALPPGQRESSRDSASPVKGGRMGMLAVVCVCLLVIIALLVVVSR